MHTTDAIRSYRNSYYSSIVKPDSRLLAVFYVFYSNYSSIIKNQWGGR